MSLAWAAPSWVIPGGIAENARFLAGKVPGIALALFETETCLNYNQKDLPPCLASLPLAWHVHLPLDLPWDKGARHVADICSRLLAKTAFLAPGLAVLHPPGHNAAMLLRDLTEYWQPPLVIALENTRTCDILSLGGADFLDKYGYGLCVDAGHCLGYAQRTLAESDLPERADLWHWSAPGAGDEHLPLTALTAAQKKICARLLARGRPGAPHVLEVFSWAGVAASLPVLAAMLREERNDAEIRTGDSF